ncbi:MAG: DUF2442 domain-containing protein [Chloroflexi bacterium]|nr:DUF2442 domain-containing protein [Chloroflexota bacterium]
MNTRIAKQNSHPVSLRFEDNRIWITLNDARVIGAPLDWFPWLANAAPEKKSHYELHPLSVYWPDLDDGLDIEALLTGNWTTPMAENKMEPESR